MATAFETVGNFEVILSKIIGKGSFGDVYQAKQVGEDKVIAAKRLKEYEKNPNDPVVRKEIENLNKLPPHNNLVNIIYHEAVGEKYWIFMEMCDLGDLKYYLQKNNPDISFKLYVMKESMKGLNFLHENDIIHRDIKPQNILLQTPAVPSQPNVKITDFGLSKFLSEGQSSLMHTYAGTAAYMAPELFEKPPSYRRNVDIFSMGLVFLVMLQFSGGESDKLIPRAEDSVQSTKSDGEQKYATIGEAMFMRDASQSEIVVAVSPKNDPKLIKDIKRLINGMTTRLYQRRPNAAAVLKYIEGLNTTQEVVYVQS